MTSINVRKTISGCLHNAVDKLSMDRLLLSIDKLLETILTMSRVHSCTKTVAYSNTSGFGHKLVELKMMKIFYLTLLGFSPLCHGINISTGVNNYDYRKVLGLSLQFYEAQRSGQLPADNRVLWRRDAMLNDKGDNGEDLSKGYFDAGDHVKFGFPMAAFVTVLAWGAIDYSDAYLSTGNKQHLEDTITWAADYFVNAHPSKYELYVQVGDGNLDHGYWGRPEEFQGPRPAFKITQNKPGSEVAGETAAALAAAYIIFKTSHPNRANVYIQHAKDLYDFANEYRGIYSDSVPEAKEFYRSYGFNDELGWSAAWLYRATGEEKYRNEVNRHWDELGLDRRPNDFSWDDKLAGLHVLMAQLTGESKFTAQAQYFCDHIIDNVKRTPKGLVFISKWGSLRYAANAAFICLQAGEQAGIERNKYANFAKEQIDYALGSAGRSYVCGFGNNPPVRPHHRGASCPNRPTRCDWDNAYHNPGPNYQTLTGALVGGPDEYDQFEDRRDDYVRNEIANDYNAGFQSTIAGLVSIKV